MLLLLLQSEYHPLVILHRPREALPNVQNIPDTTYKASLLPLSRDASVPAIKLFSDLEHLVNAAFAVKMRLLLRKSSLSGFALATEEPHYKNGGSIRNALYIRSDTVLVTCET